MIYRFVVCAPDRAVRDALKQHLSDARVGSAVPIERYELLHRYLNLSPHDFPVAERLADVTLSLPVHAGLTDEEIDHVVHTIRSFHP
jgi:dTDP-4-amino-4,6-dideoxygalactose transaminase